MLRYEYMLLALAVLMIKMERLDATLYRYYRTKGARAESREGVRFLRAFMVGRDTTLSYLNRNQLTEKYIRRYEKVKNFFPMFHFRRPGSGIRYFLCGRRGHG